MYFADGVRTHLTQLVSLRHCCIVINLTIFGDFVYCGFLFSVHHDNSKLAVMSVWSTFLPESDYVTFGYLLSQIRLSSVRGLKLSAIFLPLCTLAILWPPCKNFTKIVPFVGGVKRNRGSKIERECTCLLLLSRHADSWKRTRGVIRNWKRPARKMKALSKEKLWTTTQTQPENKTLTKSTPVAETRRINNGFCSSDTVYEILSKLAVFFQ